MFGILRFILATTFIFLHLTDSRSLFPYGYAALFGFYIMSGYLMTYGLNRNYGFSSSGSKNFWANRLLRIVPIYYLVFFLTVPLILSYPGRIGKFHDALGYSLRPIDIIGNLTLVPFTFYDMKFRVVPPSWSVGVEIACYIVLWLFIARSKRNAIITAAASFAFAVVTAILGLSFTWRYQSVPASLLPFALGSLVYFYYDKIKNFVEPRKKVVTAVLLAFLLLNPFPGLTPSIYRYEIGFYLNVLAVTGLVAVISMTKIKSPFLQKVDRLLGDLTYPMFLLQWAVAFVVYLKVPGLTPRGYPIFLISFPLIILVALLIVYLVDRPLQHVRDRFRPHKTELNPSAPVTEVSPP
jgi:peptidoglycan/LPS O-acetylase OafA/YrhL